MQPEPQQVHHRRGCVSRRAFEAPRQRLRGRKHGSDIRRLVVNIKANGKEDLGGVDGILSLTFESYHGKVTSRATVRQRVSDRG